LQDGPNIEDFKYLSKGKVFPVPTLSLSPLCPRTSKPLSMGEEVGTGNEKEKILEFKEEQIKNFMRKKKRRKMKKK
jgi:hypothetical protein